MALMEMLVDPVLSLWVPAWVVEQYKRWNPKFGPFLARALEEDAAGVKSNREILARVWCLLERDRKREERRRAAEQEEAGAEGGEEGEEEGDGGDGAVESGAEGDDEAREQEDMAEDAILRGDLPVAGGAGVAGGEGEGQGAGRSAEQELSAAGPAPGLAAPCAGEGAKLVFERAGARVDPVGHDWEARAFVSW